MTIEVTYNVTDIYISSEVSPIYIDVNYQTSGGGSAVWGGITGTLSNQTDLQTALDLKLDESTIDGGSEGQILTKNSATDFDFAWIDNYAKYMSTNVRNQTGSTIGAFNVVYISGATGNKPLITLSDADTEVTSSKTYGVTKQSIANNGTGDVVTAGELSGIDTSAFAEGDRLWLSSTPGGVVTSPPAEPAHSVFIGTVIRSHPTLGIVDVNIQNGYELTELHGVQITSETNNQGLFYDGTSSLWVNKSIPTVLGYTPEQPLTFSSPLSRLVNAVSIPAATSSVNGYLSSTDWSTFNSKQSALNGIGFVKVTGTTVSYDNSTYYLASNPSGYTSNLGTVTSVAALTLGTTGTDVSSTVATGTTTPVITLNIPTASATNRGALSSTDWSTFNSKQGALTLTTTGTSGAATLVGNTLNIPQYSGGGMAIGGSITSATAGSVLFAGTSGVLAQDNSNLFWDNTNKFLGIGTNTPAHKLHVIGTARVSADLYINLSTGSIPFIGSSGIVSQNNSNFFWDNTNIRLGLGTNAPSGRLHTLYSNFSDITIFERTPSFSNALAGSVILRGGYTTSPSTGAGPSFAFQLRVASTINDIASFGAARDGADNSGYLSFATFSAGTQTEKMQVRANGNVIIQNGGTFTDAGFRLDVNGTARVQSTLTVSATSSGSLTNGTSISLASGYTGAARTDALIATNSAAGTGADLNTPALNSGASFASVATTAGYNSGVRCIAFGSTTKNLGFYGDASVTGTGDNIGAFARGYNTTGKQVGGFFAISNVSTFPTISASAALISDNGTSSSDSFIAQNNGVSVFKVKSNGRINMSSLPTSSAGLSAGDLWNNGGVINIV